MELLAVCIAQPRTVTAPDKTYTTAIGKQPVAGTHAIGPLGIDGDAVANTEVHGGADKAVLAYAAGHAASWETELPMLAFGPGAFGENLHIGGCIDAEVCLGDRWAVGTAVLEVSHPRQPCWKLSRHHGQADLAKRSLVGARTGWYLRVIEPGTIEAGQAIARVEQPYAEWPLDRVADVFYNRRTRADEAAELAGVPVLAEAWAGPLRGS